MNLNKRLLYLVLVRWFSFCILPVIIDHLIKEIVQHF